PWVSLTSSGPVLFHGHRRSLATADAGGAQPEALALPAQGVQQVARAARAARRERVPDGDRAAVHVGPGTIEPQLPLDGEVLRRERLVHLDEIHLLQFHPRLLERLA